MNILKACKFAAEKHKNQKRKDENKTPYINHPIDVAEILSSCGIVDENVLISALLHDTIEDTKTTKEELIENFGEKICNIVLQCSDDKLKGKIQRKQLQIDHAKEISDEAKLVKLADKLSNLRDLKRSPPSSWSKEEINGYFIWSFEVCKQMFGLNDKLDKLLKEVFNGMINEKNIDNQLINYYKIIDKSE